MLCLATTESINEESIFFKFLRCFNVFPYTPYKKHVISDAPFFIIIDNYYYRNSLTVNIINSIDTKHHILRTVTLKTYRNEEDHSLWFVKQTT